MEFEPMPAPTKHVLWITFASLLQRWMALNDSVIAALLIQAR